MKELKPGDRVAIYSGGGEAPDDWRVVGVVKHKAATIPGVWEVALPNGKLDYFHRKQLRRLVKKERRRVWIDPRYFDCRGGFDGCLRWTAPPAGEGCWTEFVETRRKP